MGKFMLAATHKIKILIVEDDTPVAMMIAFFANARQCKTEVASTSEESEWKWPKRAISI